VLYREWHDIAHVVHEHLEDADAAIVTSYCGDGRLAAAAVRESDVPRKVFYDLDSPITLDRVARGEIVAYLPDEGFAGFDLVLSYAGGTAIDGLKRLGASRVAPLYGCVDPVVHRPVVPSPGRRNDLSYLGTYSADRQDVLERLFVAPARVRGDRLFALAGSQYPADFPWTLNMLYFWHVPPADHPSLFCSSGLTLNITRGPMAAVGHCPSGRLFEATACGAAVVSDWWDGLDRFFAPPEEILIARDTNDVLAALDLSAAERERVARRGRERTLDCHTAAVRARELEQLLEPSGIAAGD
jgi:spore maturation protein CgeB